MSCTCFELRHYYYSYYNSDIAAVGIISNVFIFDTVWDEKQTYCLPNAERMHYLLKYKTICNKKISIDGRTNLPWLYSGCTAKIVAKLKPWIAITKLYKLTYKGVHLVTQTYNKHSNSQNLLDLQNMIFVKMFVFVGCSVDPSSS